MPLPRSPLHPKGGRGSASAPATHGTLESLPPATVVCCRNTGCRRTGAHRDPPKHPKTAAPSPPPAAWHVPGVPTARHGFASPISAFIPHLHQTSGRPRSRCGREGAGGGGLPRGPPIAACLPGARPGPGADGPARHGRLAWHRVAGHGTAQLRQLRPPLPGHGRQRFGFPQGRRNGCGCRPCQDCPMSPNPPAPRTRADTPQTFLAINRPPPAHGAGRAPLPSSELPPWRLLTHPKITSRGPKNTRQLQNTPRGAMMAPTRGAGVAFTCHPLK